MKKRYMQNKKDENEEIQQNTSTRELFLGLPSGEPPTEKLLDIDESDKKFQQNERNASDQ
jgi:hypothetical protein